VELKTGALLDAMSELMVYQDLQMRILWANQAAGSSVGVPSEQLLGRHCYEIWHQRSTPCENCPIVRARETGQPQENEITSPDGRIWLIHGYPLRNAAGVMEGIFEVMQEITDRKRTENALREAEERFRILCDASFQGVFVHENGRIIDVSHALLNIFGYDISDVVGEMGSKFVDAESWDLIQRNLQTACENPYEIVAVCKDGTTFPAEIIGKDCHHHGRMARVAAFRDITERKRVELRLETQLRQAQKMEAIGTLAGGIAHDFNNILMAMLGYAEMAKIDLSEETQARGDIEEVLKAGRRARDLVRQILAFSRQIDQERQPIQLHPVIKEALKLLRASLPATIEIQQNIDVNCGAVLADPTQIHQVMMNLCANAYHAMREKGGILGVELCSVDVDAIQAMLVPNLREGPYVRLTVSDTGHGMDRTTMERIFDPFFTTKGVGEGTGMGLATVHGIVTSHSGAITVYSKAGSGTTFHIYLPRLESKTEDSSPQVESIPTGHERILIVDDEASLVRLGKQMLERLGYNVTTRTSSVETLELFRAEPDRFDLVITDQTMPNLTGVELAEELLHIRPDIPIILATGFSETVSPEKAKQLGIREYIMKPIATHELAKVTRQVLDEATKEP
jgi:PAS domain S-box-containing protein